MLAEKTMPLFFVGRVGDDVWGHANSLFWTSRTDYSPCGSALSPNTIRAVEALLLPTLKDDAAPEDRARRSLGNQRVAKIAAHPL